MTVPSAWPGLRRALLCGAAAAVVGLIDLPVLLAGDAKPEPAPFAVRQKLDIAYADGERQKLDVFSPEGVHDAPVVLFVHGGAWTFGDKDLFGLYRGVGRFL